MNTQNEIKKGNYVMVFIGSSWERRKVLFVEKTISGNDCYIVRMDRDRGRVFQNEVKAIN